MGRGLTMSEQAAVAASLRLDVEDLATLAAMIQLGAEYIDEQDEPGDQANIPRMEAVLAALADLVPVEAAEDEPADEPEDEARTRRKVSEVRDFVRSVDGDLQRQFPFAVQEVRDSGSGSGVYTVKGHAAVFNKWSLDLGGFRERVKRGAFDNALSNDPHVLHLWDHDTARALSSTRSKTYPLELRADPAGLYFYSKVAPTTYSEDLRVLLEGGVIDQSSFAFTVARDEWKISEDTDGNEVVERTIVEVDQLFDVTTCAMGAYPTTDSALAVRNLSLGRDKSRALAVAQAAGGVKGDAPGRPVVTPRAPDKGAADKADIERLKAESALAVRAARERLHRKRDTT